MLRIAEIEIDSSSDDDEEGVSTEEPHGPVTTANRERRVSFSNSSRARHDIASAARESTSKSRRSPPPAVHLPHPGSDEDEEEEEDDGAEDDDDDEDAAGLSLQRFPSASAGPPRLVKDDGEEPGERDEPVTPTEEELRDLITGGKSSEELTTAYRDLAGCPCHGQHAPKGERVWEIPGEGGVGRRAVVQVEA